MYLHREDIKLIQDILNEMPSVQSFRLESDNDSGIGSALTMIVQSEMFGKKVDVTFEINGVDKW
jgi:hypothetical protein